MEALPVTGPFDGLETGTVRGNMNYWQGEAARVAEHIRVLEAYLQICDNNYTAYLTELQTRGADY